MRLFEKIKGIFAHEERAGGSSAQNADPLLTALFDTGAVTREQALQVPTISGGIDLISGIIASTPIKLYRDKQGRGADEITDDVRLRLLNDEPGGMMTAYEFWRAIVRDYYLGKGGYAYIKRESGKAAGLFYVEENQISVVLNSDPIFKDADIYVGGKKYFPFEFLRVLRNSLDGVKGTSIVDENPRSISAAYNLILLEQAMARRGGNKKGFLQSARKLTDDALRELRTRFKRLYSNDEENVLILNDGVTFKESSDTAAEMQLNENKKVNAEEFSKLFHVSPDTVEGKSEDISGAAKLAAIPLMMQIQCALNRDLRTEEEKTGNQLYFAFDTKELLKGTMKERFEAYKIALDANFMRHDEVRYLEDLEPLGIDFLRFGLNDVFYDPQKDKFYTPNTNRTAGIETGNGT